MRFINRESIYSLDPYIELYSECSNNLVIESFYTDDYKEYINSVSDDYKKYREIINKQRMSDKCDIEILSLDESVSEISRHLDIYYEAYKLPKMQITNEEWDLFFDSIYEVFRKKEITSVYYQSLSTFIRSVLSRILLSKCETLTIEEILKHLDTLAEIISYSTPEVISPEEISELKNKILGNHKGDDKKRTNKIVNINSYKK